MKKTAKRLRLHRETVHRLEREGLRAARAAVNSEASVCRTCPGDPTCAPCGPTITRTCC